MNRGKILSFCLGFVLLVAFGLTTDQILQNVYDSSNTALRTNLVAGGGGGTITGSGTAPNLAAWSSSSALTNYAGATCPTPQVATGISAAGALTCAAAASTTPTPLAFGTPGVLAAFAATELGSYPGSACTPPALALSSSAAGVWTCATPVPAATATPIQATNAPVAITLPNSSSTGTTVNKLAKLNSDGTVVITTTSDTVGAIGPVISGAGTTGSALIGVSGAFSCAFEGGTTAGDYVGIGTVTNGDCKDIGTPAAALTASLSVLGTVTTTNGGAGTYTVIFQTPDITNVTNIKGGAAGKYPTPQPTPTLVPTATPIVALSYSSALNSTSITAISASATPAATDRYIRCTSGSSSDQTYTLPAATGTGRVIEVKKIDSGTKNCIVAGAGSDKIDGAASYTLSAQYQAVTVQDVASAVWDVL